MSESSRRNRLAFTLLALWSLVLSGCVTHHHHYGSHQAPARGDVVVTHVGHGHVHVNSEHHVTLVYDSGWGGYWVRELPHHYYHDGFYFRWHANRWHRSRRPNGPWVVIATRSLPRALDRHYARIARVEAKEAWNRSRSEARQDRRDDRQEARQDRRDDRQDFRQERREDREEARQDRHDDRQDFRQERREEKQEARQERRDDGQQARREARDDRRETRAQTNQERPAATRKRREARGAQKAQRVEVRAVPKNERHQARASHPSKKKRGGDAPMPADQADDHHHHPRHDD